MRCTINGYDAYGDVGGEGEAEEEEVGGIVGTWNWDSKKVDLPYMLLLFWIHKHTSLLNLLPFCNFGYCPSIVGK